ncbi:MAG: hypothetical protein UW66_C0005G0013 [Candidatus Moranbacteria bacterium GW2011_GWF1_44_4]|nr:MAG: hypothetical protein UW66_C0005G0013 [Candidatus Moranbacteria bacterium GW2011_GWF1_44_4]
MFIKNIIGKSNIFHKILRDVFPYLFIEIVLFPDKNHLEMGMFFCHLTKNQNKPLKIFMGIGVPHI